MCFGTAHHCDAGKLNSATPNIDKLIIAQLPNTQYKHPRVIFLFSNTTVIAIRTILSQSSHRLPGCLRPFAPPIP